MQHSPADLRAAPTPPRRSGSRHGPRSVVDAAQLRCIGKQVQQALGQARPAAPARATELASTCGAVGDGLPAALAPRLRHLERTVVCCAAAFERAQASGRAALLELRTDPLQITPSMRLAAAAS